MHIVKDITTSDMFRPECIRGYNVATVVLKLYITIKIMICLLQSGREKCN